MNGTVCRPPPPSRSAPDLRAVVLVANPIDEPLQAPPIDLSSGRRGGCRQLPGVPLYGRLAFPKKIPGQRSLETDPSIPVAAVDGDRRPAPCYARNIWLSLADRFSVCRTQKNLASSKIHVPFHGQKAARSTRPLRLWVHREGQAVTSSTLSALAMAEATRCVPSASKRSSALCA